MSLRSPLREPFFEGAGTSTLVPYLWDCAIRGRTFMFDPKFWGTPQMARSSIPLLKPQQDAGSISEQSLNPADGIRAAIASWHHGAGQVFLDRNSEVSDPYRFRSSKGLDPWTKWQISQLPDTASVRASANSNLAVLPVSTYCYVSDGTEVYWSTDLSSWTSAAIQAGEGAQSVKSITSDGYYLYAALGSNGIHQTVRGATASSHYSALSCTLLGYVKGRLMAANGNAIYNVIASGAAPSALYTHPNTDFTWVGFAEGLGNLYAAGYSGDKSLVYRTSIKADGTALDVPVVAGELPDGEIVRSIGSYLGLILLGTDNGWWVADQDANGNLTLNKVQDTTSPVYCFEGQGDFIWYGWSNYDTASTGLGRADLRSDTKGANVLTPAYASDLMASTTGSVLSVATFNDLRVFAVSGVGIYAEQTTAVASGTFDSGLITFGMPDAKVALSLSVTHDPLEGGTITAYLAGNDGTFVNLGTASEAGSTSTYFHAGEIAASSFEIRLVLAGGATVTRVTLEADPAPGRGETINVALLMYQTLEVGGRDERFDVASAYAALTDAETSGLIVTYQDALGTDSVLLEEHDFVPSGFTPDRKAMQGTYLLKMRRPRRRSTN